MPAQVIRGNQSVQIQNVSDSSIQITYQGQIRLLPLAPAVVALKPTVTAPARLLKARSGVIPYTIHRALLAKLQAWCHGPAAFAGFLVGGRGGAGKTRLGVELCSKVGACDWLAGLLAKSTDEGALDALVQAPTARLLVVDYAETRVEDLAQLLPQLDAHATAEHPVRVLLLVRAAPRTSSDWTEAIRGYDDALDALADNLEVRVLADEPFDEEERERLFAAAAGGLAPRIAPGAPVPDHPRLDSMVYPTPLAVVAAVYLGLVDPGLKPSTAAELMEGLLDHEDRYWRVTGPNAPTDPQLRRRVVALATLAGAASEGEAAELLRMVPDLADASAERRFELARWAHALYPGPLWWNPLEPDLLGEHLVVTTFPDLERVQEGVLGGRKPEAVVRPLEVFGRLAADWGTFIGRDVELADLIAFATGREGYRWLVGGPWTGKTALVARLTTVLSPSVDWVAYFLRRRGNDADSAKFLSAVSDQLVRLLAEESGGRLDDPHVFRQLWARAAARSDATGRHLLLIVDGLDEDIGGIGDMPSVASLLPSAVGSHAHVLVTSRPHPALPPDVEIDHPIRRVRPVVLQPSPAAARLEERAGQELTEVLAKGVPADARRPLDRKVLAFLTAARGALAPADLASLTGADLNAVDSVLAVRISRVVSSIGFGEDGRYGFAHESLLLASEQTFARREDELEENTARIVEWAADWQHRGWPIEQTPTYLLDSYPEMLAYRQLQGNRFAPSAVSPQELVHDPGWIAAAVARLGVERAHGIIRLALDPSRVAP